MAKPMKIKGKLSHYAHNGEVKFSFSKFSEKNNEVIDSMEYDFDLLFEIYKKFKNSNIEITITKTGD